jgi:hypothetical protein
MERKDGAKSAARFEDKKEKRERKNELEQTVVVK